MLCCDSLVTPKSAVAAEEECIFVQRGDGVWLDPQSTWEDN